MHRNLVLPVSLLLLGLVGCRAQEERKALQNSVTRLEQKLNRLDETMRAQQAEQEAGKDAKAANDQAMADMKRALDEARAKAERADAAAKQRIEEAMAKAKQEDQGRAKALEEARARLAEFERRFADARGEMENRARDAERMRGDAERQIQEMRRALEQAQREAGEMRQQMARQQGERRDDGRMEAIERLAAERREIEKLRAQVMADVARSQQQDPKPQGGKIEVAPERLQRLNDEMANLRKVNEALKKAMAEAKQAMAGGKQADGGRFVFLDVDGDGTPDARAESNGAPDRRITVMRKAGATPEKGTVATLDDVTPATKVPPKGAAVPMPPAAAAKAMMLPLPGGGSLTIENEHCEVHIHVHGNAAPTMSATPMALPPKSKAAPDGEVRTFRAVEVAPAPAPQQETPPAKAPKAVRARKVDGADAAPAPATGGEAKKPATTPEPKKAGGGGAETIDEELLGRVLELLVGPV